VVRKTVFCSAAALALICASCSSKNNLCPVSGKVMYKDAPAAGAVVFFHRQRGDLMNEHLIMGLVQDDGSFELVCGPLGKGAPPGEYDVVIEWNVVAGQGRGRTERGPDKLGGRYADPKHPRLQATIKNERNQLAPFVLIE
jgi:hypothetical protein